ncbi:MAG: cupin domain-containing protein [Sphingobacteriales bacterium]|nr:MAG: cupin domain-containing protein [Sphingobacteriales bacterium]
MPYTGQTFVNQKTGEVVTFTETSKETNGSHVTIKSVLKQGGGFKVNHIHPFADEIFEVISGTLSFKLNGVEETITAGHKISFPRNQAHAHWNNHPEDLVILQTITPCLDVERFLETLFGLGADGYLDQTGQPPFLQVMVWLKEVNNRTYLADIPVGVQNVLASVLTPVAKLLGYRAFYPKYTA